MSRLFGMVAAAALLTGAAAFAQEASAPSSTVQPTASAAASADDSGAAGKPMHKHRRHSMSAAKGDSTDKLNACLSNAVPTSQQEQCLKSASGTGNG